MISPEYIKEYCLKQWKNCLLAHCQGRSFFPLEITRIGKVSAKNILSNLAVYQSEIAALQQQSKAYKKRGYDLVMTERHFDRIGKQQVPEKAVIADVSDYLYLIQKASEYQIFIDNYQLILQQLPQLKNWIEQQPQRLVEHNTWADTLKVCQYFIENPQPNLYLRQLPIAIHTKYIIENESIIQSLLNYLLKPSDICENEKRFEPRFHLQYAEPLIRIRFLDAHCSPLPAIRDISLPVSDFERLQISDCHQVFVAENLMNFLTLPAFPNAIALWSGGGFQVAHLKKVVWLQKQKFYYWGDLDAQGFQILNQFRAYFSDTVSLLMDEKTLQAFPPKAGRPCPEQQLLYLNEQELKMYNYLKDNNLRLEQEQISQDYAERIIAQLVKN